ncbi:MAG: GldG family protein [Opitutaceae bacterium]|nr:GldG family protein [Opitutaceae bacterium]
MKSGSKLLALLLLLVGLVAVNYLASSVPVRLDATAEKIYTLSPGTRALLSRLEEPVKLELYYSRNTSGLPISLKNYAARVQEMLRQYARASQGKIELVITDPRPDTPAEERATAAGLQGQPMPSGEAFYLGLVAVQAEQQRAVPFLSPQREQFLEYDLSQLIYGVELREKRRLGLISGLPLRAPMDMMAMQSGRMPQDQFVLGEWEKTFEVVSIEANATELPANLDALAVIHPQNLASGLQFSIDQFLLSGKPVFLALDPASRLMRSRSQQMAMYGGPAPGASSDLPTLLNGWGIDYRASGVVGDLEAATQVQTGPGRITRHPAWLSLTRAELNRTALPTSQLESLLFVEAGAVALKPGTNLNFTPLVESTDQAGELNGALFAMSQPEDLARALTVSGRKTLAALVQGKFKSAFPDGRPAEAPPAAPGDPAQPKEDPAKPAAAALKESTGTSTLLVIADTDWLLDDYLFDPRYARSGLYVPANDNLALAGNALEFLSGSQDLISIRGKGSSIRPFTVVRQMEAAAQRQYQEQLTALEARIGEVQNKLTELQGKRTEGNRLVATPEMTKAIEDFQKQAAAMRGERRQVRAALREGIESLGNRLLVLNLLATPCLVGAFGLWFFSRRKSR